MGDWHARSSAPSQQQQERVGNKKKSLLFNSRRSPVICKNGCVSSSQPLASSIGLQILRDRGGNAADASIAVAAALAVLEPCSTGLGGDMFALTYSHDTKKVEAVNGSGRAPSDLSLDAVLRDCGDEEGFMFSAHSVTVPGAAKGWEDLWKKHGSGKLSFLQLLEPAIALATEGFPVAPFTSHHWRSGMPQILKWVPESSSPETVPLSIDRRGPLPGEVFRNPHMAAVLERLGRMGSSEGFYEGETGRKIVEVCQKFGGAMRMEDLRDHVSTFPEPIMAEYRGVKLWQVPPNGQGIAGLIALKGLSSLEEANMCDQMSPETLGSSLSASSLHVMIEMTRLGFADARAHVADEDGEGSSLPEGRMTVDQLLDTDRISTRAKDMFNMEKAVAQGMPDASSGTVSFQVVDGDGNAISFVNSNFMGFGTGIVPDECGFTLQNRGYGFSLDPTHPNVLAPNKRPYHTIIPGMLTHADSSNDLYATLSNMGGFMQPQGHFQLTLGMIVGGLDPQAAIDTPRFCIADGTQKGKVFLEEGIDEEQVARLGEKGHDMIPHVSGYDRSIFGKAQIIKVDRDSGVMWAGSDGRADGCAIGY